MTALSGNDLDKFRGKHIGLIFQSSHFIKSLTVKENLMLAQHLAGESQSIPLIREILANLNIEHKLDSKTERLSVGEQQRVAIARAMINAPGVLLADEPTSALDDKNCESVIKLLQEQASAGDASLVIVTHDARLKSFIPNQILLS
jgi:putative ABC transport system ATP-binding protein